MNGWADEWVGICVNRWAQEWVLGEEPSDNLYLRKRTLPLWSHVWGRWKFLLPHPPWHVLHPEHHREAQSLPVYRVCSFGGGGWQVSHGDPKKGLRNSRKKLALSGNKIGGLLRVGARGGVGRSSPRTPHSFLLSLSLPPGNPWQVHTDTAGTCSMLCLITVEGPGR